MAFHLTIYHISFQLYSFKTTIFNIISFELHFLTFCWLSGSAHRCQPLASQSHDLRAINTRVGVNTKYKINDQAWSWSLSTFLDPWRSGYTLVWKKSQHSRIDGQLKVIASEKNSVISSVETPPLGKLKKNYWKFFISNFWKTCNMFNSFV